MKFFIGIFFLSLLAIGHCGKGEGSFADPEYPGKCVFDGVVLSPGEQGQIPNYCYLFKCHSDDGYGELEDYDSQYPSPGCQLGDMIDSNAPFPGCGMRYEIC